ncbi:MAG TPA: VanZ family protein [Puia sp.]|nr:VanZ family protein [Puia sp.]
MIPFFKKYLAALYVPISWTLIIGILMCLPGSALPSETAFKIPQFDKIVHIGLFGGFTFLWDLYLSKRVANTRRLLQWFFLIYVITNAYGISMEYVQKYWIPGRDYDLADIIADMIGAGLGYGCSHLFLLPADKLDNV